MAPLIKELHPKHIFTSFSNKEVREEKGVTHVKRYGKDVGYWRKNDLFWTSEICNVFMFKIL